MILKIIGFFIASILIVLGVYILIILIKSMLNELKK